ncbi:MAG: HPF/RaiA family ribosome-associated protein [Ardenticatenaceae bacterium]|nr:HPF/RaiA family ribosome-associated protein [Ardenticatenaceae bacterium]HBY95056.1 hypothetical protein [Chloroflexota bacterium]
MIVEIVAPELGGEERNRDIVFKTLAKLDKYLTHFPEDSIFARVALGPHPTNDDWVRATIDLSLPGAPKAVADADGETTREALNQAAEEVERQLRELKERRSPD